MFVCFFQHCSYLSRSCTSPAHRLATVGKRRNQTRNHDHEEQLRKVMFGFYKTNGFTPLSCPLEMAANRFHAHYDSTDAALRPSETTSHRANGNTELWRYYSTCACATGIKVHISLLVTHREHSVFRISRTSRGKRPHARRPLVRRTPASRFNMHLVDTFLSIGGITSTKCGLSRFISSLALRIHTEVKHQLR